MAFMVTILAPYGHLRQPAGASHCVDSNGRAIAPFSCCRSLTQVERTALHNAASVASLLLTTDGMVAERPKTKGKGGAGGPGSGMPDYGGEDMDY